MAKADAAVKEKDAAEMAAEAAVKEKEAAEQRAKAAEQRAEAAEKRAEMAEKRAEAKDAAVKTAADNVAELLHLRRKLSEAEADLRKFRKVR